MAIRSAQPPIGFLIEPSVRWLRRWAVFFSFRSCGQDLAAVGGGTLPFTCRSANRRTIASVVSRS